jgi:hypothetical protein
MLTCNAANVTDLTRRQGPLHGSANPATAFVSDAPFPNLTGNNSYPAGTINPATSNELTSLSVIARGGIAGRQRGVVVQPRLRGELLDDARNAAQGDRLRVRGRPYSIFIADPARKGCAIDSTAIAAPRPPMRAAS